jgi:hypothetical protein
MKQKVGYLKRLKDHKPLANMTKWRREKTQINKIKDKKGS